MAASKPPGSSQPNVPNPVTQDNVSTALVSMPSKQPAVFLVKSTMKGTTKKQMTQLCKKVYWVKNGQLTFAYQLLSREEIMTIFTGKPIAVKVVDVPTGVSRNLENSGSVTSVVGIRESVLVKTSTSAPAVGSIPSIVPCSTSNAKPNTSKSTVPASGITERVVNKSVATTSSQSVVSAVAVPRRVINVTPPSRAPLKDASQPTPSVPNVKSVSVSEADKPATVMLRSLSPGVSVAMYNQKPLGLIKNSKPMPPLFPPPVNDDRLQSPTTSNNITSLLNLPTNSTVTLRKIAGTDNFVVENVPNSSSSTKSPPNAKQTPLFSGLAGNAGHIPIGKVRPLQVSSSQVTPLPTYKLTDHLTTTKLYSYDPNIVKTPQNPVMLVNHSDRNKPPTITNFVTSTPDASSHSDKSLPTESLIASNQLKDLDLSPSVSSEVAQLKVTPSGLEKCTTPKSSCESRVSPTGPIPMKITALFNNNGPEVSMSRGDERTEISMSHGDERTKTIMSLGNDRTILEPDSGEIDSQADLTEGGSEIRPSVDKESINESSLDQDGPSEDRASVDTPSFDKESLNEACQDQDRPSEDRPSEDRASVDNESLNKACQDQDRPSEDRPSEDRPSVDNESVNERPQTLQNVFARVYLAPDETPDENTDSQTDNECAPSLKIDSVYSLKEDDIRKFFPTNDDATSFVEQNTQENSADNMSTSGDNSVTFRVKQEPPDSPSAAEFTAANDDNIAAHIKEEPEDTLPLVKDEPEDDYSYSSYSIPNDEEEETNDASTSTSIKVKEEPPEDDTPNPTLKSAILPSAVYTADTSKTTLSVTKQPVTKQYYTKQTIVSVKPKGGATASLATGAQLVVDGHRLSIAGGEGIVTNVNGKKFIILSAPGHSIVKSDQAKTKLGQAKTTITSSPKPAILSSSSPQPVVFHGAGKGKNYLVTMANGEKRLVHLPEGTAASTLLTDLSKGKIVQMPANPIKTTAKSSVGKNTSRPMQSVLVKTKEGHAIVSKTGSIGSGNIVTYVPVPSNLRDGANTLLKPTTPTSSVRYAKLSSAESKPSSAGSKPSSAGSKPSPAGSKPSSAESKPSSAGSKPSSAGPSTTSTSTAAAAKATSSFGPASKLLHTIVTQAQSGDKPVELKAKMEAEDHPRRSSRDRKLKRRYSPPPIGHKKRPIISLVKIKAEAKHTTTKDNDSSNKSSSDSESTESADSGDDNNHDSVPRVTPPPITSSVKTAAKPGVKLAKKRQHVVSSASDEAPTLKRCSVESSRSDLSDKGTSSDDKEPAQLTPAVTSREDRMRLLKGLIKEKELALEMMRKRRQEEIEARQNDPDLMDDDNDDALL